MPTAFPNSRYRIDYYQKPHTSPTEHYEHLRSLYYDTYQEALETARRASQEKDEYCVIVDRERAGTLGAAKGIVFTV